MDAIDRGEVARESAVCCDAARIGLPALAMASDRRAGARISNRMFGTFGGDFLEQMVGKVGATDWCVFDRVMQQNNSRNFEKGG
jgi:hypothetical protein